MRQSTKNKIKVGIVFSPIIFMSIISGYWWIPFISYGFVTMLAWLVEW